jgi:hypothetical protein
MASAHPLSWLESTPKFDIQDQRLAISQQPLTFHEYTAVCPGMPATPMKALMGISTFGRTRTFEASLSIKYSTNSMEKTRTELAVEKEGYQHRHSLNIP